MTQRFTPRADVHTSEMDDGYAVLLDMQSQRYLTISPSALLLWRALEESSPRGLHQEAMTQLLTSNYDVSADVARTDVEEFVGNLMREGLLREAP